MPGGPKPPAEAPGAPKAPQPPVQPGAPAAPRADAPMPPPPGPGNDEAGKPRPALLPPMNATQSREQVVFPVRVERAGLLVWVVKPGRMDSRVSRTPGRPGAPDNAVSDQQLRPQLPPQEQAPFTPKELQRSARFGRQAVADR
ncbi:hypothetical protein [Agrobacterium vitis]|uniref:Uncharacterized protein n=1 Tax=Agrobacterium vitis TaxID=373 RepID=A0AAE2RGP5_AGRVI|nr:hypothetical protein [Agrobacterium vitis]MBF2716197.1 hypothetical protein [Agrobacterium vitis]